MMNYNTLLAVEILLILSDRKDRWFGHVYSMNNETIRNANCRQTKEQMEMWCHKRFEVAES
jgi:hypothetical protein